MQRARFAEVLLGLGRLQLVLRLVDFDLDLMAFVIHIASGSQIHRNGVVLHHDVAKALLLAGVPVLDQIGLLHLPVDLE